MVREYPAYGAFGSRQNGVVVDGSVVRVFPVPDAVSHATADDHIPRVHRQVPRCPPAIHQVAVGAVRGESSLCQI